MKFVSRCIITGFCFFAILPILRATDSPRSLVVMLDGVRADAQRMAKTPNIDSLMDGTWAPGYKGVWTFAAHTIRDAPTVSAPNHTAIATGVTAGKNQVKDNSVFADYNQKHADSVYHIYLSRIKQRYPKKNVAFLYSWGPDENLVKPDNPCDLALKGTDVENARLVPQILIGTYQSDSWKKGTDIDALLFYIDLPDAAGHAGGFSPPGAKHDGYLKSIETCDAWVGDALKAIRNRPNFSEEHWQIIICSDHGGWVSSHGAARADNYTVPLVVSSKNVVPGRMLGQPCTTDVAVTVLDHFGFDVADMKRRGLLDGLPRGKTPAVPVEGKSPEQGLIVYLPFDGDVENKVSDAGAIKPTNRGAAVKLSGGKKGGYLEIRASDKPAYVTLENPAPLKWGRDHDFSVALWLRLPEKNPADPVIFGNKDWNDGGHTGVCLFVAGENNGNGNNLSLNLADRHRMRVDTRQLNMSPNQWWFCAATVDRKENATLYAGGPDGKLYFCSMNLVGEGLGIREWMHGNIDSPLPWNIGTDGTGNYKAKLSADLDEFRIWNRCLDMEEIEKLYQKELK